MRSVARLVRFAAASVVATSAIVAMSAQPAAAFPLIDVKGNNNVLLGWGRWSPPPAGSYDNGFVEVRDTWCDGANGIIAALAVRRSGAWKNTTVVSVRGCDTTNYSSVKPASQGGPTHGEDIRFSVCKLTPDGVWKDCQEGYSWNGD